MSHPNNERLIEDKIDKKINKLTPQEFIKFYELDKEYINVSNE